MASPPATFRYTGDGRVFRPSLIGLAVLAVVEVPVIGFLVRAIVPGAAASAIQAVLGAVTLAVLLALASPLLTRHRIDGGVLRIRYGLLVAADVPLEDVEAVRPVRVPVGLLQPMGALVRATERGTAARVTFSESGQLELRLRRPCRLRAGWTTARVDRLTINADDPDGLAIAVRSANG